MYSVTVNEERANEDEVIETIFNACRANEQRDEYKSGVYTVEFHAFEFLNKGEFMAIVNKNGKAIGSAVVDSLDC